MMRYKKLTPILKGETLKCQKCVTLYVHKNALRKEVKLIFSF